MNTLISASLKRSMRLLDEGRKTSARREMQRWRRLMFQEMLRCGVTREEIEADGYRLDGSVVYDDSSA